jgi:hypothetical protein
MSSRLSNTRASEVPGLGAAMNKEEVCSAAHKREANSEPRQSG